MKESTLLEMKNKIEAMGRVIQMLLNEINNVRTLSVGDYVDVYTASGGVYYASDGRHGGWGGWLIG